MKFIIYYVIIYDVDSRWVLKGAGERIRELTVLQEGRPAQTVPQPLTVQEVCRLLGKSQRQVYRYLKAGRLRPCARILGQWLFSSEEVERFRKSGIPVSLKVFFWDVQLSDLSADHHRDFILGRLLETGNRKALRWLFQTYSRNSILAFLSKRGTALLSQKSWHFWALQLGKEPKALSKKSWRSPGRRWGGVG